MRLVQTLWHTRRRSGGAAVGREAVSNDGTARTVAQRETGANALAHASAADVLQTLATEDGQPFPPTSCVRGDLRQRSRRRLLGSGDGCAQEGERFRTILSYCIAHGYNYVCDCLRIMSLHRMENCESSQRVGKRSQSLTLPLGCLTMPPARIS